MVRANDLQKTKQQRNALAVVQNSLESIRSSMNKINKMQKQGSDLIFEGSVTYVDVVEASDNTMLMGEEVLLVITDT